MRSEQELRERLESHKEDLEQWDSGFLSPTEPDSDEREKIKRELKAVIYILEWALGKDFFLNRN